MDTKETIALITVIKLAYPNAYKDISAEERQLLYSLWQQAFQEIPYQLMQKVVSEHISYSKFPPLISDINDLIDRMKQQAYRALDAHNRQLKENANAERYGETAYKVGELLSEEQLHTINETLRVLCNRETRINERVWTQSQKKLGGRHEKDI